MTLSDYAFLCKLLRDRSGLSLAADKHYLVESRLAPVARKFGLATLSELVQRLKRPETATLLTDVVEAMTTNESLFYRDRLPFEHFRNVVMPALLEARAARRRIRIWCAAASSGQEPYSLAMCLREMDRRLAGWCIDIVATDLSTVVLEKARSGVYSQFEVQRGLPIQLLIKYFSRREDAWQIAPELRAMVQFRSFNLLDDFSRLGRFDLVLCRNVLIYFDAGTKTGVLDRLARVVEPDGYLMLGAAETLVGLDSRFSPSATHPGLYIPHDAEAQRSRHSPVAARLALAAG